MNLRTALFLGLCVTAAFATAHAAEQRLDKTFDVAPGGKLLVQASGGSVTVTGSDAARVVVHVVAVGSQEDLDRAEISAEQQSGGVSVIARPGSSSWLNWLMSGRFKATVTVAVPHQYHVDIDTSGGNIAVSGLEGDAKGSTSGGSIAIDEVRGTVRMNTSGGSIEAARIGGDTTLTTSGGKVVVRSVTGNVKAQTSGGSIHVEDIKGRTLAHTSAGSVTARGITGDVDLETSGGSIHAQAIDGAIQASTSGGSVDVELAGINRGIAAATSGGSVTVRLPRTVGARIDASTSGGTVSSELPVSVIEQSRKNLLGVMNEGGPTIKARTSGGSINLLVRTDTPAQVE